MDRVIVIHARLPAAAASWPWQEALLQALPYAKRLELERRAPAGRVAGLAGLGLALSGTARHAGQAISPGQFIFPPDGRPRFDDGPWFSISHTSTRVACAICRKVEVGLDVEDVPAGIGADDHRKRLRWTAVEATLKAAGLGIRSVGQVELDDSRHVATLGGRCFVLHRLDFAADAVAHVAAPTPVLVDVDFVRLDGPDFSATLERCLGLASQRG